MFSSQTIFKTKTLLPVMLHVHTCMLSYVMLLRDGKPTLSVFTQALDRSIKRNWQFYLVEGGLLKKIFFTHVW